MIHTTPEMEKGKDQEVTRERGERTDDILTDREKQWVKRGKKCAVINLVYVFQGETFFICADFSQIWCLGV